jgi:uncharacterized protein
MNQDLMRAIFAGYTLPRHGIHGVYHWARVLENGTRIAEETGADLEIIQLFSIFHDCRRVNEGTDPEHGRRGADFAHSLNGHLIFLAPEPFHMLRDACTHHTKGWTDADPTVQACWDADRLDLPRVGIDVDPERLCTDIAKEPRIMEWADDRACEDFVSPHAEQWLGWLGGD